MVNKYRALRVINLHMYMNNLLFQCPPVVLLYNIVYACSKKVHVNYTVNYYFIIIIF